jgi:integrase
VHQCFRVLRTALEAAVRWGYPPKNPCGFVKPPRLDRVARPVWDEEQTRLFLAEARRSSRYYALYLTLLTSGLRPGEALALQWPDVDLAFERCTVRRKLYRIGQDQVRGDPKTHREYTVSIPHVLAEELGQLKARQADERRLIGSGTIDRGLVFAQPNGKPLHLHNITQRDFRAVVARASLPHIRLFDLRHCHATHLARGGARVTVTQSQLGHRSSSTTLRYVHPMPDLQQEHVARLADRVLGRSRGSRDESEVVR